MGDLRERFRALDDVMVPDLDVRERPRRSLPVREPRMRPRRLATIAVAALVAVGSLLVLVRAFQPVSPREPVDVGTATLRVTAGDPIPVGRGPNAIAVGAGGVWVSAVPADGPPYHLVRLDPVTGDVVARIRVPALPTWEVGGGGLLALDGGVWATGVIDRPEGAGCCGDAIVFRVDPTTNEVTERIDLGPGSGADLWIDDTGVWVLIFDDAAEPGISLVRLDPISLEEVARIPLPTDWAKQVFAYDDSIWIHGNREGASEGEGVVPDVLFRVDPATNRYVGRIDLPSGEFPLAVDPNAVWQRTSEGVIRVKLAREELPVALDGLWDQCACSHIASDGDGGLWVVGRSGPSRVSVFHVAPNASVDGRAEIEVPEAVLESVVVAFDAELRTIWLAQYDSTVTPLRIVSD